MNTTVTFRLRDKEKPHESIYEVRFGIDHNYYFLKVLNLTKPNNNLLFSIMSYKLTNEITDLMRAWAITEEEIEELKNS